MKTDKKFSLSHFCTQNQPQNDTLFLFSLSFSHEKLQNTKRLSVSVFPFFSLAVEFLIKSHENRLQIARQRRYPAWWPFDDISPYWFSFTVLWPVAVAIVFRAMQQNKLNSRGVGKRS
jgi:hypothetical protein